MNTLYFYSNTSSSTTNSNSGVDNNSTNRYEIQDNALVISLLINSGISIVVFLTFCFLRKRYPLFYQYRYEKRESGVRIKPSNSFFGWIVDTVKFKNQDLIDISGLDGYMYLVNLKTNFKIVTTLMAIGWIMLFPVNSKGKYNENRKVQQDGTIPDEVIGLSTLSMGNIEIGSSLLWAHFWFVSIVTVVVIFFTFRDYKEFTSKRIQFKQQSRLMNYTMFVRDIPVSMFSKDNVINYFSKYICKPSDILDVSLQYPVPGGIHSLIDEREFYIRNLDSAVHKLNATKKRPTRKSGLFGWCGKKVDSINYYSEKIEKLEETINKKKQDSQIQYDNHIKQLVEKKEQYQSSGDDGIIKKLIKVKDIYDKKSGGSGFIVFKSKAIPKILVQTIMGKRINNVMLQRSSAPDPNDVYWPNIHIGAKTYFIRYCVVLVMTFLLVFFFSIPVTFLASISNLGTLQEIKAFSWLVDLINKSPRLTGFLTGFLPSLALIIFMSFLIPIITIFAKITGYYSFSRIEASVFSKYFLFLVFNVFLVSAIAGSIFQSIGAIINNPPSITATLANSLGGLSFAMINYVLLAATALTMNLLRITPLIIMVLKLKWLSKTKREIQQTTASESFKYGQLYAYNLLILQLCFAYSTLAPFILIFGVWYFGVSYLVHKYNIIWVNTPHHQSGAFAFYPMSFRRTLVALLIYQLLMIGTFNVYKFYYGSFVVVPFIVTIIYWIYCEQMYYPVSKHGILDTNESESDINNNHNVDKKHSINSQDSNDEITSLLSKSKNGESGSGGSSISSNDKQQHFSTFNDTCYSFSEYNENLYKPPFYSKLMEPEESIIDDYVEIVNSKPPDFLNV